MNTTKTQTDKKTLSFGKVAYSSNRVSNEVEIDIELRNRDKAVHWETLEEIENVPELSICGGIWNSRHTDYETFGQCLDTIKEYLPKNKQVARIVEIWKEYHLNDLKAGTRKQTAFLNALEKQGWEYEYNSACESLKQAGLYEDNGYKYGHGWLYQPIPDEIINEVKELINSF